MQEAFDGGFNIKEVSRNGSPVKYTIHQTMMRIDMATAIKIG